MDAAPIPPARPLARADGWAVERARLIAEASEVGSYEGDLVTGALSWSPRCREIFGLPPDAVVTSEIFAGLVHPDDRARLAAAVAAARDPSGGGTFEVVYRVVRPDGRVASVESRGQVYHEAREGRLVPVRFLGTVVDLTRRFEAEAALRVEAARHRLALRAGGLVAFSFDPQTGTVESDHGLAALFGLPADLASLPASAVVARIHEDDRARVLDDLARAVDEGVPYRSEFRVLLDDGGERWLLGVGETVVGASGRLALVGYNCDVTERRRAEAALAEAIAAKEALLDEVNHRVTNSLQLVTGLIRLQLGSCAEEGARRTLEDASARIGVVASVHRRLCETSRHDRIDLGAELCETARRTVEALAAGRAIVLDCSGARRGIELPVERAMPLAIVVSELVTNALKYAFPDGRGGTIALAAEATPEGGLAVRVADDGVGLPDTFDLAAPTGVGGRIVAALVRRMGARLEIGRGGAGARFALHVPDAAGEP